MGRTQSGLPGARILAKYLRVLSRGKENDTLLEADPVGDFLARKRAGVFEPGLEVVRPDLPPVLEGLDVDTADDDTEETAVDSEEGAEEVEEAAIREVSSHSVHEETPAPVLEELAPNEDTTEEDATQTEAEEVVPRTSSMIADIPEGKEADENMKSLLDIFKSEQLCESPISTLSKELSDTDIYALLKETKEIAQRFRRTANLYQISGDFNQADE